MANQRVPQNWQAPYTATSLLDHFASSTLTVATCAYLRSSIGNLVVGITSHSSDLSGLPGYPGVTFKFTTGASPSRVEHPSQLNPANLEQDLFMLTFGLTEADVLAGKWDHAEATVFDVNFEALNMGQLVIARGHLSRFEQMGPMLRTELRGLNDALSQMIGRVTEPNCQADVYDDKCKLDPVARGEVYTSTLTHVTDQDTFRDTARTEGAEWFDNAKGSFNSGPNAGFPFHVKTWDASTKTYELYQPMPFMPTVGDSYTIFRGCKKRKSDCFARGNVINIRSFPDMPTIEQIQRLPAQ